MKYTIRAIKYFLYFSIIFCLILGALVLTGMADTDLSANFRNGYDSFWQIALMFAAVSALYPKVAFINRRTYIEGGIASHRDTIITFMEERDYRIEAEDAMNISFRKRTTGGRLAKMWEDRIIIQQDEDIIYIEGMRKDVLRLASGLEYKISNR